MISKSLGIEIHQREKEGVREREKEGEKERGRERKRGREESPHVPLEKISKNLT
jgi:hypothetical protein